jgi:hypothetical protein
MKKMQLALMLSALAVVPGRAASLAGQEPAAPPSSETPKITVAPPPSKQPFTNIFVTPGEELSRSRPVADSGNAQPRIVCGMTLVPARPELDPKMVAQGPPQPTIEYKARAIRPRVCRE